MDHNNLNTPNSSQPGGDAFRDYIIRVSALRFPLLVAALLQSAVASMLDQSSVELLRIAVETLPVQPPPLPQIALRIEQEKEEEEELVDPENKRKMPESNSLKGVTICTAQIKPCLGIIKKEPSSLNHQTSNSSYHTKQKEYQPNNCVIDLSAPTVQTKPYFVSIKQENYISAPQNLDFQELMCEGENLKFRIDEDHQHILGLSEPITSTAQGTNGLISMKESFYSPAPQKTDKSVLELQKTLFIEPIEVCVDSSSASPCEVLSYETWVGQLSQTSVNPTSRTKPPIKQGQYMCTVAGCKKTFRYQHTMSNHSRFHTGEKPFKCDHPTCQQAFKRKLNLLKHKVDHKNMNPNHSRKFVCSIPGCTKSYIKRGNLQDHLNVHLDARPHACDFPGCNQAFRSRSNLCSHRHTHVGKPVVIYPLRSQTGRLEHKIHAILRKARISQEKDKMTVRWKG